MLNTKFSPWPSFSIKEAKKAQEILLSNRVNYWTGQECKHFEKEFADYTGTKYAVSLMNGTVALDVALISLGIGKGDEVIVTSRTFLASVTSIVNSGAKPVFADIDRESQNITPVNISQAITKKTKAIICVHLAGWPCDMDEIKKIAKINNCYIIEDCAQAHGAKYKGKSVGSIGDIGCWSFCQDKIITTGGEGGMVTTNNKVLWKKMWSYKDHGKSYDLVHKKNPPKGFRWLHESFGTNLRMLEIQGAIGRIQLRQLDDWVKKRNTYQNKIWETSRKLKGLRVPNFKCSSCNNTKLSSPCIHAAYKCYVFVENKQLKKGWSRDKIADEINKIGVPCVSGSCSEVYLEKAFKNTSFIPKKRLKIAQELGSSSLAFLVHPSLTSKEIDLTCKAIKIVMYEAAINQL